MSKDILKPRSAYRHWQAVPTRWSDNDVYGHVNNVVYYSWFDTAVNATLINAGLLDIEHGASIGLVVETMCRYARPISFPTTVQAGICVEHLGNSSVRYGVGIFTADNDAAAAMGHFVHVYVDRVSRRPQPLNAQWRSFLETLQVSASFEG
jgi:acyl-CoA thioester hydrolase